MARILIAELNWGSCAALRSLLLEQRHVVDVSTGQAQIVTKLEASPYNAIILAVGSPTPDNIELLRVLRSIAGPHPRPKVIYTAVSGTAAQRLEVEESGARWVICSATAHRPIIEELDLVLLEAAQLQARGPRMRIYHRADTYLRATCRPGEEVVHAVFLHRLKEAEIRLSPSGLLLLDYMARCRFAQTADQIARGMAHDPFSLYHLKFTGRSRRRLKRAEHIKVEIGRIRKALGSALVDLHLDLTAEAILVTDLASNRARYRLRAATSWEHIA